MIDSSNLGRPALFVFDRYPGGLGFSEQGFARLDELARAALEHLVACECGSGCPSCVGLPILRPGAAAGSRPRSRARFPARKPPERCSPTGWSELRRMSFPRPRPSARLHGSRHARGGSHAAAPARGPGRVAGGVLRRGLPARSTGPRSPTRRTAREVEFIRSRARAARRRVACSTWRAASGDTRSAWPAAATASPAWTSTRAISSWRPRSRRRPACQVRWQAGDMRTLDHEREFDARRTRTSPRSATSRIGRTSG